MRSKQQEADYDLISGHQARITRIVRKMGYATLSDLDRLIYSVWWLEGDVNNGGFDQYFFNSAGDHYEDALNGLTRVGALRAADIVRRAIQVFASPGPSKARRSRQKELAAMSDEVRSQFDALDAEFFKYPDDIEHLVAEHVRTHPDGRRKKTKA